MAKRTYRKSLFFACSIFIFAVVLNNDILMKRYDVVNNNVYSLTQITTDRKGDITMSVNHSISSKIASNYSDMFAYVRFIEQTFIMPTVNDDAIEPLDILILGAGGFTMGYKDLKNNYTYVDIDKDLKDISEMFLLRQKLEHNKEFAAKGARAFLNQMDKKYDLIIVDLYSNQFSIPSHLITREFYQSVKNHLNTGGIIAMNIIASPHFKDKFSRKIDATIRGVFTPINRHLVHGYSPWTTKKKLMVNTVYIYIDSPEMATDEGVYTDNLNTYFLDK